MFRALAIVLAGATLAVACSSAPRATEPSATANPDPSPAVLGATYGSPTIADIATARPCTLVSIGELRSATATAVSAPVATGAGTAAPGCSWAADGTADAITLSLATADAFAAIAGAVPEEDLGDEAQWVQDPEGGGRLVVLVAARDRVLTITVTQAVAADPRAAARAIALAIIPRA